MEFRFQGGTASVHNGVDVVQGSAEAVDSWPQ